MHVLHNDIKPHNIVIDKRRFPKLIDFGISCDTRGKNSTVCSHNGTRVDCCPGIYGTPQYGSPEMIMDNIKYPQSDIWSLGISFYNLATGGK